MIASLPMYPFSPAHVEAFWQTLRTALPSPPLPASLSWPDPLLAHWQRDDLLLSQTCGYPLMTTLPDVQVVGAFCYSAAGCNGPNYLSWIVVREEESGQTLPDFSGRRLAFNSEDSQSGYHSLMKMTAGPEYFSATLPSGGHRRSVALLRSGKADIAAIDCVSWALLERDFPEEIGGLKIIAQTASVPGLPVITSAQTSAETLHQLRIGLAQVIAKEANGALLDALFIKDFMPLSRAAWQGLLT